jgi:ATP-dependent DNA helicase RecQ
MQPTGVFRPNLRFAVLTTHNEPEKRQHLVRLVREFEGTGIVYAASVRQVDLLHRLLHDVGLMAARDHRRMPRRQRLTELARFESGKVQAIVATCALTTHVSKPDVRFALHYALPTSLDTYYDEARRAGLDGGPAHCVMLYDPHAARADDEFVSGDTPSPAAVAALYATLARRGADGRLVPRTTVTDELTTFGRNESRAPGAKE